MAPAELRRIAVTATFCLAVIAGASRVSAQAIPADGRFSLFSSFSSREVASGETTDFTEVIATFSVSGDQPGGFFEYAFDGRIATYPSSERDERVSIYEAFVGLHSKDRRWKRCNGARRIAMR